MSVEAAYNLKLQAAEVVALGLDHVEDPEVTHDIGDTSGTLTGTTSPAATKGWSDKVTLSGGSASLDLTALPFGNLPNVNFNGLRPQLLKVSCPTTNTGGITIEKKDAVTGYNLFGADNTTAEKITVLPGQTYGIQLADAGEDVDATHKDLTLTGTGSEVISMCIVAG